MEFQLQVQVEGKNEFIDLFPDENISLDLSFAEIQDITKKNSAFTKEFNVPGSKNNNYIFNYFFDFNSTPLDWFPQRKFEAQILYNGYIILEGYVRLNNVSIDKVNKTYNITFYNGVGDVAANIGDKFLRELDLSYLGHPFVPEVYLESQLDWNLFPLTGTTDYSYQNGKTFWGLYNIGYNYTASLSAITSNYQGTSNTNIPINSGVKTITTNIALPFLVGETIRLTNPATNNFIQGFIETINGTSISFVPNLGLGTGTYNVWNIERILPEGQQITDPLTTPLIAFQQPNIPNYFSFSGTPIRNYYFKPSIQVKELYEQIFNQAGYFVDSNFFNTNYFERFYLPLKFLDETIYTKGALQPCYTFEFSANTPNSGVTCDNGFFSADTTSIYIPSQYQGIYTFRVYVELDLDFVACPTTGVYYLDLDVNGTLYTVASQVACDEFPGTYRVRLGGDITLNLNGATTLTIVPPSTTGSYYLFGFQVVNAQRYIVGNFDYAAEFPDNDYKQIDFITSVNKLFNLVVVPHPSKQKTLIVEPINEYIGKGKILDWTDKIDWDSPIQINPTTNILNGTLNMNFKLDKDSGNQQFNIASNRVFGTFQKLLNQDYKDQKIDFNVIFGSPVDSPLNNASNDALTICNMAAIKNEEVRGSSIQKYNPYRILPRIVFRGPVIPNLNWGENSLPQYQSWWAENQQISYWQEVSRFTTYPFALSGFSQYINWNSEDTTDTIQSHFPTMPDLYNVYYSDYIDDITSVDNKIVSAKIYLTPWEIKNLRFDEKIIIKNGYYRINKITGFSLTEPGLCNIELIKLTRDYETRGVKYYDLINCASGGTDYHTNSDLNYNLYAYVGNYVNIFTGSTTAYTSIGCFQVVEGSFNENYTYEPIFIGSGYTASSVGVYSDCGCSGSTAFDIIQQV